jgi:hypothetical protein
MIEFRSNAMNLLKLRVLMVKFTLTGEKACL